MRKKQLLMGIFFLSAIFLTANQTIFAAQPNNSTPVLFPVDTFPAQTTTGTSISYQLTAYDPDSVDILTFSMSPAISGANLDPATGIFTWTPNSSQIGLFNIDFSVTDGIDTATLPATITIIANPITTSQPPVIEKISDQSVTIGQTLNFKVKASSPSGLALKISATSLPKDAKFNSKTNTFSWVPTKKDVGNYTTTFFANDGKNITSQKVNISVEKASSNNTDHNNNNDDDDDYIKKFSKLIKTTSGSIKNLLSK